jgi:hypothetical protein
VLNSRDLDISARVMKPDACWQNAHSQPKNGTAYVVGHVDTKWQDNGMLTDFLFSPAGFLAVEPMVEAVDYHEWDRTTH